MSRLYTTADEGLHPALYAALENGKYRHALNLATQLELAVRFIFSKTSERNTLISLLTPPPRPLPPQQLGEGALAIPDEMDFYSVYMLCFLLANDLDGARHLWSRAPQPLKAEDTQLAAVHRIGQSIWQQDVGSAYQAMKLQFSPPVAALTHMLRLHLLDAQLRLISLGYSTLRAEDMAVRLDATPEEVQAKCQALGWEVDADGFVLPKPLVAESNGGGREAHEGVDLLARLSQYVAHFEQKPVKVDLKTNKDSTSGSSSSSSSSVV